MITPEAKILKNTEFDRKIAPKTTKITLLVDLMKNKAINKNSAIKLSKYRIKPEEMNELIQKERIKTIYHEGMKIYLTRIGKIIAMGELALQKREAKK